MVWDLFKKCNATLIVYGPDSHDILQILSVTKMQIMAENI